MNHVVNPFIHVSLLASIHCSHWSGFCYTTDARPSLRILSAILLLPCVMEILQLWVCKNGRSFHMLQQITDGVDIGVGKLIILILSLGICRVGHLLAFPSPHQQGELSTIALTSSSLAAMGKGQGQFCFHALRVGSPTPILIGPALQCCPGEMQWQSPEFCIC